MNQKVRYRIGEDMTDEDKRLAAAAKAASADAIRRLKALGLPITFIRDGKVIEQAADGTERIIEEVKS